MAFGSRCHIMNHRCLSMHWVSIGYRNEIHQRICIYRYIDGVLNNTEYIQIKSGLEASGCLIQGML